MIFGNDAEDVKIGDFILFSKKVLNKVENTDGTISFCFEDGTMITVNKGREMECSTFPVKYGK
jgi:hypothetical protein